MARAWNPDILVNTSIIACIFVIPHSQPTEYCPARILTLQWTLILTQPALHMFSYCTPTRLFLTMELRRAISVRPYFQRKFTKTPSVDDQIPYSVRRSTFFHSKLSRNSMIFWLSYTNYPQHVDERDSKRREDYVMPYRFADTFRLRYNVNHGHLEVSNARDSNWNT